MNISIRRNKGLYLSLDPRYSFYTTLGFAEERGRPLHSLHQELSRGPMLSQSEAVVFDTCQRRAR